SLGGCSTLCQATNTFPSLLIRIRHDKPLARLRASSACVGVCTIGEPTFNEVLTETSTPRPRPIALRYVYVNRFQGSSRTICTRAVPSRWITAGMTDRDCGRARAVNTI